MTYRTIHFIVTAAGKAAGINFPVHPHMPRGMRRLHPTDAGQDARAMLYLGHKNIQQTIRYTELSPLRFKDFWRD
jgi:site-specific recombinase XerD